MLGPSRDIPSLRSAQIPTRLPSISPWSVLLCYAPCLSRNATSLHPTSRLTQHRPDKRHTWLTALARLGGTADHRVKADCRVNPSCILPPMASTVRVSVKRKTRGQTQLRDATPTNWHVAPGQAMPRCHATLRLPPRHVKIAVNLTLFRHPCNSCHRQICLLCLFALFRYTDA